jgi:hypothetical protein
MCQDKLRTKGLFSSESLGRPGAGDPPGKTCGSDFTGRNAFEMFVSKTPFVGRITTLRSSRNSVNRLGSRFLYRAPRFAATIFMGKFACFETENKVWFIRRHTDRCIMRQKLQDVCQIQALRGMLTERIAF